jgi:hypothetical protein
MYRYGTTSPLTAMLPESNMMYTLLVFNNIGGLRYRRVVVGRTMSPGLNICKPISGPPRTYRF